MPKFLIEIWFAEPATKIKLSHIIVEAETEEKAFALAKQKTEYWPVGEL